MNFQTLTIIFERFKVSAFMPAPWRCYHCQGFGHNANNCKSGAKCLFCAGNHLVDTCPNKLEGQKKCGNCNGNHTANYGGCMQNKNDKVVQNIRIEENISYRDAVKKFNTISQVNESETQHANNILTPSDASVRPKLKPRATNLNSILRKNTNKVNTTTQKIYETGYSLSNNNSEMDFVKLAACLLEMIPQIGKETNLRKKCAITCQLFKKYFGKTLEINDLINSSSQKGKK